MEIVLAEIGRTGFSAAKTITSTYIRGAASFPAVLEPSMSSPIRASAPRPPTALPQAAAAQPAATPRTAAPAQPPRAAAAQTPWAFRGGPNTEVGKTIQTMVNRARQFDTKLGGDSVERMLTEGILKNPRVTNDMLMKMSQVPLDKLADTPADRAETERRVPGSRDLPSHKFTVGLLSAITGADPAALSRASPGLGVTGSPGTPVLFAPERTSLQRSTALHDTTDYLKYAGVPGLNKAVWGSESSTWSAAKSLMGVPY
jgi:hypothetical protein